MEMQLDDFFPEIIIPETLKYSQTTPTPTIFKQPLKLHEHGVNPYSRERLTDQWFNGNRTRKFTYTGR